MESVELLAPAKDVETGVAAIACGADAVYIGGAKFGAREAAGNSLSDIEALVNYAHKYWARVYVTLNTLLYDSELAQAEKLAHDLYEAGADALIIQDAGLLELDLPPLPLFASTQMHNHTAERVAFLEKVGISRVILARELSLEQIRQIRALTKVELETFVHGALCVSYSGQCYMSYALGGRSGNRGQCAQPCRRPYRLVDQNGATVADMSTAGGNGAGEKRGDDRHNERHWLSLRDFNATNELGALLDAGVRSFKIEGRLKDKTYVMNVVGHYRQQLDALLEERGLRPAASGQVRFDFTPDPRKSFNRGFTSYFLHGRKEPVGAIDTPKSLGEPVGKVARMARNSFTLESAAEIHRGDGLCFFNRQRELAGTTVNDVQVGQRAAQEVFPDKMEGLQVGTPVFRNHDHAFQTQLEKSQTERKIGVRFRLAATMNGLALFAQDLDGNEAMAAAALEKVPAEKPEQALATIEKQLRKLGGTPFECLFVRNDLPEAYFIPMAALNGLRREALEALEKQRVENYPRPAGGAIKNDAPYPEKTLTYLGNVLNEKARAFYQRHGVSEIEMAAEWRPASGLLAAAERGGGQSPDALRGRKVMTTKHCIKHQLGVCAKYGAGKANLAGKPQEPLALVDEQGNVFPLRFNCAKCVMEVYLQGEEEG